MTKDPLKSAITQISTLDEKLMERKPSPKQKKTLQKPKQINEFY